MSLDSMKKRIDNTHALSKGNTFKNMDAVELLNELHQKESLKGYSIYLDPDYVNFEGGGVVGKHNMKYNEETSWMKEPEKFNVFINKTVVPIVRKGGKIVITNEYNETVIKHLQKVGFSVYMTTRANNKPEMVVCSFKLPTHLLDLPQRVNINMDSKLLKSA
jgi:hypothetical protein